MPVSNSSTSVWTNIIVSGGLSVTGNVYVAKEPEIFSYDADGNLTNDGRWAYTWDAENRLIQMTANTSIGPQYQLAFTYDWQGRRIQKIVSTNSGSGYVAQATNFFAYDGWNLLATGNPLLYNTYMWGLDLSGSLQGGGGVCGLLGVSVSNNGSRLTNTFAAFDGNGNVMALVDALVGKLVAEYDYGPFGEPLRLTGGPHCQRELTALFHQVPG